MKVAYIAPSLDDTTGWGRWCVDFLHHVSALDVDPVIFAPESANDVSTAGFFGGHIARTLPDLFDHLQSTRGIIAIPSIARFMRNRVSEKNIRLVHSLEAYPWGIYGHHLAHQLRVPHILTTHGRYGYIAADRLIDRRIYKQIIGRASAVIAVSEAVCNAIRQRIGQLPRGMSLVSIQNAVDATRFSTLLRPKMSVHAAKPIILSVTRFVAVKDLETAILAFEKVLEEIPDARYVIVGPGNGPNNAYHLKIESLIAERDIKGVEIVGRVSRDDLSHYYQCASLLLHTARTLPDDFEASGLILLEAGLFGLPVVASTSGGIPEVVAHNSTGLLAPEHDPGATAAAIVTILKDPALSARMGEANRRRALQRNWPWYMAEVRRMYERALPD